MKYLNIKTKKEIPRMKKLALALAITAASTSAMADNITVSMSQATQDLSIMGTTYSEDNTGVAIDWHTDTMFGMENLGYGFGWNGATKEGNVLSAYLKPHMEVVKDLDVFIKAGAAVSGATTTVGHAGSSDASVSPTYGLGATYFVSESFGVTAEYQKLYSDDVWDMTSMNVGVTYRY